MIELEYEDEDNDWLTDEQKQELDYMCFLIDELLGPPEDWKPKTVKQRLEDLRDYLADESE